jgi:hypothetical protein
MQLPPLQTQELPPQVSQALPSSLNGGGQALLPVDESHGGSVVHWMPSSQMTPVQMSTQLPPPSHWPELKPLPASQEVPAGSSESGPQIPVPVSQIPGPANVHSSLVSQDASSVQESDTQTPA